MIARSAKTRFLVVPSPAQQRYFYHELSFQKKGEPIEVLAYHCEADTIEEAMDHSTPPHPPPPKSSSSSPQQQQKQQQQLQVRVDMLAVPWNPADAMSVQGRYPSPYATTTTTDKNGGATGILLGRSARVQDHTVAGSEGLGRVAAVDGAETEGNHCYYGAAALNVGDYVVPGLPGLGTFRSSVWLPADSVIRLERGRELCEALGAERAAPLFQTGGTALRMLRDFGNLQPGDVVVQNAGNSAVGFMVSQLAASMGLHCVSLVRRGSRSPDQFANLVKHLTKHGKNALVVPEEHFDSKESMAAFQANLRELSDRPPRLALNAVGGPSARILLDVLGPGGSMVTYGGMSMQPLQVPTSHFIFRDLHLAGYWHSRWMAQQQQQHKSGSSTSAEQQQSTTMMNELVDAVLDGKLECPPVTAFRLSDFKEAFAFEAKQSGETIRSKVVFDCRETIEDKSR